MLTRVGYAGWGAGLIFRCEAESRVKKIYQILLQLIKEEEKKPIAVILIST